MKIVRVALDVPVAKLFDYHADDARGDDVGCRVLVPFGKKILVGMIVEIAASSDVPSPRMKCVLRVLRDAPRLGNDDLRLLRFAAAYYHHPLGLAVMGALPARLRRVRAPRPRAITTFVLTPAGEAIAADVLPARAIVQRRLLTLFKERRVLDLAAIKAVGRSAPPALTQLASRGWVAPHETSEHPALVAAGPVSTGGPRLTVEQSEAVQAIQAHLDEFSAFLLLGVTGSGKTEVYLHAIDATLRARRQVLLLVPEIALTPQLEAMVRNRFPDISLTALHSGLNENERLEHWRAAQTGRARIVLGTRLAVFAPLPGLGLIIVDEEHDGSFKQTEGLRYSARDLAVVRAQQCKIPVVLGSATPALETYYNALNERYQLLTLSRRINAPLPRIEYIPTRGARLADGLSPRLLDAIAARLECNEQSMVFINRRGFAPVLMCRACGWLSQCHRCSAQLVLHLHDHRLHCHHCGFHAPVPPGCLECGNQDLAPVGQGTQRIEVAVRRYFPQARILRIDRDSTRRRLAWPAMRSQIREREVDIVVGTQILAKGHHFPHLNLVGVVNADSLLYSTDFRAPERLFALLTQVAGRAGRGERQGEVLIQTEFPGHPLYTALRSQDYVSFARGLLEERQQAGFPPFVHQALLRAEAPKLETAVAYLARAARIGKALDHRITIYDPVPAGMVRLAGRERAQLLAQAEARGRLQRFLAAWYAKLSEEPSSPARWSLDVDPLEL
ncbi:MAG: primosomal protein N' [Betaproteobacteria bacterium RIFCSPLOWO2_12_FULL_62_13]|nr:MAG: primosomal protein N' [Betaproteobacteria bacterium RIFCSPLOWO2_12_FULL_62_13]